MSYVKQNFKDGEVLTAEQLNRIEDGVVEVETDVATLLSELGDTVEEVNDAIADHESRIATLEEGGGSSGGGGKIYRHDVVLRCSDYINTPYASVYCRFVSSSGTPITTLEEMKTYCFATEPWTTVHYKASVNMEDSAEGERAATTVSITSSKVNVNYITAYTVPLATEYISFDASVCSITDKVTEV